MLCFGVLGLRLEFWVPGRFMSESFADTRRAFGFSGGMLSDFSSQCAKYSCSGYLGSVRNSERHCLSWGLLVKAQVVNCKCRENENLSLSYLPRTGIFCTFALDFRQDARDARFSKEVGIAKTAGWALFGAGDKDDSATLQQNLKCAKCDAEHCAGGNVAGIMHAAYYAHRCHAAAQQYHDDPRRCAPRAKR